MSSLKTQQIRMTHTPAFLQPAPAPVVIPPPTLVNQYIPPAPPKLHEQAAPSKKAKKANKKK